MISENFAPYFDKPLENQEVLVGDSLTYFLPQILDENEFDKVKVKVFVDPEPVSDFILFDSAAHTLSFSPTLELLVGKYSI